MRFNLTNVMKTISKWSIKHQPEILQAMGFAAGASALVLTATGTIKAVREIDEKQPATKADTVKIAAKHYIPAAIAAGTSVAFHVGSARTYIKRNIMLTNCCAMAYEKLNKLEEKNVEVLGEKKANQITDAVAMSKDVKNMDISNAFDTGYGGQLFFDGLTGQLFRSNINHIKDVKNNLNEGIANAIATERGDRTKKAGHYPSLWDYLVQMGEKDIDHSNHYGWYDGSMIDFRVTYEEHVNGESIGIISHRSLFMVRPEYMYTRGY